MLLILFLNVYVHSQALDLHYTKQELEEMRSKVQQLEQLSVQWQAEMEAAEKKIYKITREKAAAEKAAEVAAPLSVDCGL